MGKRGAGFVRIALVSVACVTAATVLGQQREQTPLKDVQVTKDIEYARVGERSLKLDLYVPPHAKAARVPLVIWVHGGAWRSGSKDGTPGAGLLQRGIAVASIAYRFSNEATFPAQIHDCKAAVRWLRAHAGDYDLDGERFGAWGASSGGHLVALLGTSGEVKELEGTVGGNLDASSRVQAVCDFFGPTDFLAMVGKPSNIPHGAADSPESLLIGGAIAEHPDRVKQASPITYVTKDAPPFLIMHGDSDPLVPPSQSELLHEALKKVGADSTLYIVQGGSHGGFRDLRVPLMVVNFFSKHLKAAPTATAATATATAPAGNGRL